MSTSSFLFGGNPPADINTTTSDTSQLPAWYQEYLQGIMGTANSIASQPYPQYNGPLLADFTPAQNQAFGMVGNLPNATSGALNTANTALGNAANVDVPGAVNPYLTASTSTQNNPSAAANPYMGTTSGYMGAAADAMTPQNLQNWMSPYTNDVVSGLTNSANQNWNQVIMPSIQNEFTSAGQYGSGRNAQILGQAGNQFETNLEGQVANALQSGYNTAGTLAGQQAGVLGGLANTGLSQANTAAGTAAQEAGILQGAGSLAGTAAQQQGALNLGTTNAANTTAAQAQQIALQNAAAQQQVGTQQQTQTQNNLNTAYNQFQQQAMWPQAQASFMSDIIRGLPTPGSSTTVSSNAPQSPFASNSPSFAGSLASLLPAAAASNTPSFTFAKGGRVPHLADGGALSAPQGTPSIDPDTAQTILQLLMQRAPTAQHMAKGGRKRAAPKMDPASAQTIIKLALQRAPGRGGPAPVAGALPMAPHPQMASPASPMGGMAPPAPMGAPPAPPMGGMPHLAGGGTILRGALSSPHLNVQHVALPQGVRHYAREMGTPRAGALSFRRV